MQSHDDKFESNEAKKQRRKEDRLREEAVKRLVGEEDLGPSPSVSGLHVETEAQRKKRKKTEKRNAKRAQERQLAKQAAAEALARSTPPDGSDISMTDAESTPAKLERLKPASEDEDMEDGGAPLPRRETGYTAPPSGVNRAIRRRFMLIEREKTKIKKDLGVLEGSDEKADEVNQRLDEFIERLDAKTAERDINKKERKRREAARSHDKKKTSMKERRERPKFSRDN